MFRYYVQSDTETWINKVYQEHGLNRASDLDPFRISEIFQIQLRLYAGPCNSRWKEGQYAFIFLDKNMSSQQQREVFFHELCHPLRHVGNQCFMNSGFIQLQEVQAEQFRLYAAMPIYMIEKCEDISSYSISEMFGVSRDLAQKRLEQIKNNILLNRKNVHKGRGYELTEQQVNEFMSKASIEPGSIDSLFA